VLGSAFASFLVSAAMVVVDWYMARKAIRDDERDEIRQWMQGKIDEANAYKSSHPIVLTSDPFGDFVQHPDSTSAPKTDDPGASQTPRSDKDHSG
jgi:hypothetical protein